MAEGRIRLRRLVVVVLLALLLWLLFELNRFLPGSWPGGGGDTGVRPTPAGPGSDPKRVTPSPPPPPAATTDEPAKGTVRVIVRGPDGAPKADARVGWAGEEPGTAAGERGVTLPDAPGPARALRVAAPEGTIVVGPPGTDVERTRVVQWPRAALPGAVPSPEAGDVRVLDEDGKPVAGAEVEVRFESGKEAQVASDADGRARMPRDLGTHYRACASAPGRGEACGYGTTDAPVPTTLRLSRTAPLSARFVDPATRAPLVARALRLVSASGRTTPLERPDGTFREFEATMPADAAASQALEVDVEGRPVVRVPLSGLPKEIEVPEGARLVVTVRDASGAPKAKARVEARYAPSARAEAGDAGPVRVVVETDARGKATLALPPDRPSDVLVEAEDAAPAGFHVPAAPTASERTVDLVEGVLVPVDVRGEGGRALAGAEVTVVGRAGNGEARRLATTDAQGRARLGPFAPGVVEVYAHAPGSAWGFARVEAAAGMPPTTLPLERGLPLHVVVQDRYGVPLSGVRVRGSEPSAPGRGPSPRAPDEPEWVTDEHGVLRVDDLPDRPLDLVLGRPGYDDERIPAARPGPRTYFATLLPR